MTTTRLALSCSVMALTTVVLPDPDPPAMPMTNMIGNCYWVKTLRSWAYAGRGYLGDEGDVGIQLSGEGRELLVLVAEHLPGGRADVEGSFHYLSAECRDFDRLRTAPVDALVREDPDFTLGVADDRVDGGITTDGGVMGERGVQHLVVRGQVETILLRGTEDLLDRMSSAVHGDKLPEHRVQAVEPVVVGDDPDLISAESFDVYETVAARAVPGLAGVLLYG